MRLRLKEIICAVLAVLFIALLMNSSSASDKTAAEVFESISGKTDVSMLSICDSAKLKKEIGYSKDDFSDAVYYASDSIMEVREVFIIKLKEDNQYNELKAAFEKRIDEKIKLFDGYAPQQSAQLKGYVFSRKAGFVLFAVCDDSEKVVDAFRKAV